jgi:hypothetical protein
VARGPDGQEEGLDGGLVGDLVDAHPVVLSYAVVEGEHPAAELLDLLPEYGAPVLRIFLTSEAAALLV